MSDVGEDPALVGRTIAGKFLVEKLLGGGAMGAVYRARQTALEKNVAVKVMHREVANDAQFVARFHREAKAASRLDHPNSMRVIDFGEEPDGLLYIAMEYLEGRDLFEVIHEDWPLSNERIVDVLSQALAAIAVAHDMGVIHRDLKPENIMMLRGKDDEGRETDVVKVCDFGIAKIQEAEESAPATGKKLTTQGLVVGTPEYMSPEQARGEKLDARSDVYSIGVILYQLVTGRTPFTGDTALGIVLKHITEPPPPPREIYAGVHPALESICLKAMAKAPADRFQTAREMRSALRSAIEGRPAPVDASSPTIGAPTSSPAITAAATAPTMLELPTVTPTTSGTALAKEVASVPPKTRSKGPVAIAAAILLAAGAGGAMLLEAKNDESAPPPKTIPVATATASATSTTTTTTKPAPTASASVTLAKVEAPTEAHAVKHTTAKTIAKVSAAPDPMALADPPEPQATPAPPPPQAPPETTQAPPPVPTVAETQAPPPPPPAPAFNPATCRAQQTGVVPHGVNAKDLSMKGTVDAWTACARSSLKDKPVTTIAASVHLSFSDSRAFLGATCAGCPPTLAACVASSTGRTVSLQFKSGDVTGDPSFDVGVTFTCE